MLLDIPSSTGFSQVTEILSRSHVVTAVLGYWVDHVALDLLELQS